MRTLFARIERQQATAGRIADWLAAHPAVKAVHYPGLKSHPQYELAQRQMKGGSTLVAFDVAGGKAEAFRLMNGLRIVRISNNLGDSKSLITHPATSTHQRLSDAERAAVGISPGSVRLSVGLEDPADLIEDLEQALAGV